MRIPFPDSLCLLFLAFTGIAFSQTSLTEDAKLLKLEQHILQDMDENPNVLKEVIGLPTDRRIRLLMKALSGAPKEISSLGKQLFRDTPDWENYIEERIRHQWPLFREAREWKRRTYFGETLPPLSTQPPDAFAQAETELHQIMSMLTVLKDPRAVRFLIVGIYDNAPGWVELDVYHGPIVNGATGRVWNANNDAGGTLIANAPKGFEVAEWRTWWTENKDLYIPPGKSELFPDLGAALPFPQTAPVIPPELIHLYILPDKSKLSPDPGAAQPPPALVPARVTQKPADPAPIQQSPATVPAIGTLSETRRWGIAAVAVVLFAAILLMLLRRGKG